MFQVNLRNFFLINFSPGDSHTILGSEDMDDERPLTMVEDLCSDDVAGNTSCRSPAPVADDAAAVASSIGSRYFLAKVCKITKKKSLLNRRKLCQSLLLRYSC